MAFPEMLMGGYIGILPPRQREYVEGVHQSGAHLPTVINDVLDLAKIEAGQFALRNVERLRPGDIAQNCVDLLRDHAGARAVGLCLDLKPVLPPIMADAPRTKQVLLNLLDNAIKFSPPGGEVTLTVREGAAGAVEFIVADNGPGMGAEEARIALQPFRQVDDALIRRYEGAGLGLPLAERLAEIHGGGLRIESEKGRGTCVIVRLPQAQGGDAGQPLLETV